MKRLMQKGAVVGALAALLWPAATTYAACGTSLADPGCVLQAKCQNTIQGAVATYLTSVGKNVANMTSTSQFGKNTAGQVYACVGGPLNNKACLANNGACKTGLIGAPCNVNADCGGGAICDNTKGCNGNPVTTPDQFECQPLQVKSTFSKDVNKAQATLTKTITTKCATVDLKADLGIDKSCPAVGTAADFTHQVSALVDCIEQSDDGDFNSGNVADVSLRLYEKATGSGVFKPQSKTGPVDLNPRQVQTMTGAQTLQIGAGNNGNTGNSPSAGGTITTMSLARCVGGNLKTSCLNNADCKGTVAGTCTPWGLATDGHHNIGTAPGPVHKCCGPAAAVPGASCLDSTDANCAGDVCAYGANCDGNVLTVSETASGALTTCLVTHTRNASSCVGGSNGGLPCAAAGDCPGGACTNNGTSSAGAVDLLAGDFITAAPIATDVTLGSCPKCTGGTCDSGANAGGACNSAGGTDQACPPPIGSAIATIPNPFTLGTQPKSMVATQTAAHSCGFCDVGPANGTCENPPCLTCDNGTCAGSQAGRTCDSTTGLPHKAFCGFCLTHPDIGCRSSADCPGAEACAFTSTEPGFHGDCSVTEIDASSARTGQYLAQETGLFCTGKTGSATVDGTAGLPGPVRIAEPVINAYIYSKDH